MPTKNKTKKPAAKTTTAKTTDNASEQILDALENISAGLMLLISGQVQSAKCKVQSEEEVQSAECKVQRNAKRRMQDAEYQEQIKRRERREALVSKIAALEKELALLDEGNAECRMKNAECQEQSREQNHSAFCTLHSALPRATLAAPTNLNAVPVGSSFLRVSWNAVVGAKGYLVQYSSDANFVNDTHAIIVNAPGTSLTLSGLKPDTMYHVKVKSLADAGDSDSNFTMAFLVRTGLATGDEMATLLQDLLNQQQTLLQSFYVTIPEIESTVLTTGERRRLLGSGVRRYGFIDKVSDTSVDWPSFWPDFAADGNEQLKTLLREIEVLRNLLVFSESLARRMQDLLLIKGDEAFRLAGVYYVAVREAARRRVPDAEQVFQLLRLFWERPRGGSSSGAAPTKRELLRNFKAMLRGAKIGEMFIKNEGDRVEKGGRTVIDNTRKMPRARFNETEKISAEINDQSGELSSADYEQSEPLAERCQRLTE